MTEQEYQHWHVESDDDGIAWLHLDMADANANVLNRSVVEELGNLIEVLSNAAPRGIVILSDKVNGFVAGADIKEFTTLKDKADAKALIRSAQTVLDRIESLPFPTVAMIHGFCLGGGLELALACRYRIADDGASTKLGLPEVMLGIHPGFGGTVRLPPLIGAPAAMDMMLSGRTLSPRAAAKIGVIDYAVPARHLRTAAKQMILEKPPKRKPKGWLAYSNNKLLRPLLAKMMRKKVAKRAPQDHYPAPYALIDLWQKHADDPRRMMEAEAESVASLVMGKTAQNLIRVFFLQEGLKSVGRQTDFKVNHIHVVGGGVMGGDIAAWCAMQGYKVTIQDRKHETLARVIKRAHGLYKKKLKKPRLIQAALDRLVPDINGLGIPQADIIIEAIIEDVEAKQTLFRDIEAKAKPDAILATNTSSIPLEVIGEALKQPERLVGIHFFNPVAKMKLVEVVQGRNTSDDTLQKAAVFTKAISRLPLPVKSSPGFLVNRILMPYLLEAVVLVEEGVPAIMVDKAALKFGMPMGPIELADTVGLDICLSVAEILTKNLGGTVPQRLRDLVQAGNLGRKSGRGFYRYEKGKPVKTKPPEGMRAPKDLTDRLMLRMINESMACLREGVVEDEHLLDGGIIFGTGFAPFRGGPMHYIDETGKDNLLQTLTNLEQSHGDRFKPDDRWGQQ
jgi:3-hydroxyacyl-CoA dehydrogenase/enoyl-CoA hydratase/3-hydroxybutyryl-CoA epimerase